MPELCRMTGLTSALLDDFRAMREIKQVTHSDAPVKVRECLKLFEALKENMQCRRIMDDLQIGFESKPLKVPAYKLSPGALIMGEDDRQKRITHDIDICGRDLDRRV